MKIGKGRKPALAISTGENSVLSLRVKLSCVVLKYRE